MASLRNAQSERFDTAERVKALHVLAPVPAATLRHRTRSNQYRGALGFAMLMSLFLSVTWLAPLETLQSMSEAAGWLEQRATTSGRAIASTIFVAAGALGLAIAWARATALSRPIRLPSRAHITVDDLAAQLESLFVESDAVHRANVRVDNLHRRGVRVAAHLHVAPHADLNRTVEAVCEQTEWFLHAHLLVRLSSIPSVQLSFEELNLRAGRVHDATAQATGR